MKKYLLLSLAMVVALSAYAALDCATPPTCAELGYTQTRCLTGCTTTTCPYDSNYMKCTNCPTTSATTCPSGYYELGADELCDCTYGRYYDGTQASDGTACYRCGTYNECNVGVGQTCVRCSIDALVPAL